MQINITKKIKLYGIAISRVLSWVAIYLGTMSPRCSSEGSLIWS